MDERFDLKRREEEDEEEDLDDDDLDDDDDDDDDDDRYRRSGEYGRSREYDQSRVQSYPQRRKKKGFLQSMMENFGGEGGDD